MQQANIHKLGTPMTDFTPGDRVFDECHARTGRVQEVEGAAVLCVPDPEATGRSPWTAHVSDLRPATAADRLRAAAVIANTTARMREQM